MHAKDIVAKLEKNKQQLFHRQESPCLSMPCHAMSQTNKHEITTKRRHGEREEGEKKLVAGREVVRTI